MKHSASLLATLLAISIGVTMSAGQGLRPQTIAERCSASVVMVHVYTYDGPHRRDSLGSGFFVAPGLVVTNAHVIKGFVQKGEGRYRGLELIFGEVSVNDGRSESKWGIKSVEALLEYEDLAILRVFDTGPDPLPLSLTPPKTGDKVYVFGNPEGLVATMSDGIVSNPKRLDGVRTLIQITAPISHGSSGGPVVNDQGDVIGVVVGSVEEGQNLNFVIPSSDIVYALGMANAKPTLAEPLQPGNPTVVAGTSSADSTGLGIEFVAIPAGTFTMGSTKVALNPEHLVTISRPFEIMKYEVTQGLWTRVVGSYDARDWFEGPELPVDRRSWDECQYFIAELNRRDSAHVYRLPTEAEWEYACRAGTVGEYAGPLMDLAWYAENSGNKTIPYKDLVKRDKNQFTAALLNGCRPHPVGQKKPNAWGLFDMHGNASEWCQDWWDPYPVQPATDPQGWSSGPDKTVRGGSFWDGPDECRSASRSWAGAEERMAGLRLVRTPRR